ncbi:MAG: PSD1 and planctomycete cytochrome C domain-containing protein [Fuerstiella sp.]
MNKTRSTPFITLLLTAATAVVASAAEVDFASEIAPMLRQYCMECHVPGEENGDISLATISDLQNNEFIVPGDADASYLVELISPQDGEPPLMPKDRPALSKQQIQTIRKWISSGANWPKEIVLKSPLSLDADWWSLQPRQAVGPPEIHDAPESWRKNPIDAFIYRKLSQSGLDPSPLASRQTLIRRAALDLNGLPPAWDEVTEFVRDSRDDDSAFESVVDRLLQSPRYGERWAQHWLDVIRWAETVGFETNKPRPNAWHYRDWVIDSLNADKPYDQFIFEQIVGDTVAQDAALGFLIAGPANLPGQIGRDESAMRQARQDELDEVIRTVSQSLLGLTIDCARCHNHKFDPITQRDYYSMQAIFAGLNYGDRRLRGEQNDRWTARIPESKQRLQKLETRREQLRAQHHLRPELSTVQTETFEPVEAERVRMRIEATTTEAPASLYEFEVYASGDVGHPINVALAASGAVPSASGFALANQTRHFENLVDGSVDKRQSFPWVNDKNGSAWIQVDLARSVVIDCITWHSGSSMPASYVMEVQAAGSDQWIEVAHTRDRIPTISDTRSAEQTQLANLSEDQVAEIIGNRNQIRSARNERNRLATGPQVYAASFMDQPAPTWLLRRGNPTQRTEQVAPAIPAVFRQISDGDANEIVAVESDAPKVQRRLALAQHLAHPDHPLTARVMVNRIWQHHFGIGLVGTPSDFGKMGALPSHPELLDWLANDFVDHGWSVKHLHRRIVTSQTYRQSSRPRPSALKVDADCRQLWRFPPRRLEAEAIRDSILKVSGKLNLKAGGPGFDFFNQRGGLSDYTAHQTFDQSGWRRMIYAHKIRMQAIDIFGAFDCPDGGQMKPRRTRSITPLQSLSLLNSPFANRQAGFFADRIRGLSNNDLEKQIDHAFRIAFSRLPNPAEQILMVALAQEHSLPQVCRAIFNTSEFVFFQ